LCWLKFDAGVISAAPLCIGVVVSGIDASRNGNREEGFETKMEVSFEHDVLFRVTIRAPANRSELLSYLRTPSSLVPTARKPDRGNARLRDQPPASVDYAVLFDGGSPAEHIRVECARRGCNAGQHRHCKQGRNDGLHGCAPSWNDADDTLSSCIAESRLHQPRNLSVIR
jgi:hypothetical protein